MTISDDLRKLQGRLTVGSSRRHFLMKASLSTTAFLFSQRPLQAEVEGIVPTMINEAAKAKITVQPLRRNISILEGSGGNIAVLTGPDGKLLVDAGFAVSKPGISNALATINAQPIKHLFNTHWHTDHTDGNAWLNAAGAAITAHENTRERMSVATRVEGWKWTFPAAPRGAIPSTVFEAEHHTQLNKTKIHLKYYSPAHTDSDVFVHFTDADIIHVGDTWWNGVYPFIDYSTGGSIDGQIQAAEKNVAAANSDTIFIPGHGLVGGKRELVEFRDMLVAIRERVTALKKKGMTLDEVIAEKPSASFDEKWGQFLITPAAFTGLVYRGV